MSRCYRHKTIQGNYFFYLKRYILNTAPKTPNVWESVTSSGKKAYCIAIEAPSAVQFSRLNRKLFISVASENTFFQEFEGRFYSQNIYIYQTVAIHNHFLFFFCQRKNINTQQSLELVIIHKDRQRDGKFDNWKVLNINVIIGKRLWPVRRCEPQRGLSCWRLKLDKKAHWNFNGCITWCQENARAHTQRDAHSENTPPSRLALQSGTQ